MGRFLKTSPPANSDRYAMVPREQEESQDTDLHDASTATSPGALGPSAALSTGDVDVEGQTLPQEQHQEDERQDEDVTDDKDTEDKRRDESDRVVTAASTPVLEQPSETDATDGDVVVDVDAIDVRILDLNGKFFSISCRLDWSVARLKQNVLESTDVAVASQRLIYRGRVLEDEASLESYKVEDGHTIHLFVRAATTPDPELLSAEFQSTGSSSSNSNGARDDGVAIVHMNSEVVSSAVFPSDSARRVDPLMLDSSLGNCARRVKLWSSFLLIIYTMKVMGQFALLANDQQQQQQRAAKQEQESLGIHEPDRPMNRYDEFPQYYKPDPFIGGIELMVHCFGVYVGCVGFKAAHDTDIRPIRFYCRGVVWLAFLTIVEQIYTTVQISDSDFPAERVRYPYGGQGPTKEDVVSANVFQTIMLVAMWLIAIRHSYMHQREVTIYNQSFAAAAMNAAPPVHLPDVV